MTVTQRKENDKLFVQISGRLDANAAPRLEEFLTGALGGVSRLELDFRDVVYVSSAGLRVLLSTQKKMNGQGVMTLRHVSGPVLELFRVTGFADLLTIEE